MSDQNVVLVLGSGGREHALAWKLSQSAKVSDVYVAPGNGGTNDAEQNMKNVPDLKPSDHEGVISFCKEKNVLNKKSSR